MAAIDEPNMKLALASSYNERGVAGYTHAVTNAEDQRKINCFYEAVKNPMTGKGTLTLSKRPGVTINASTFGSTAQTPYLLIANIGFPIGGAPVVFSTLSTELVASSDSTTTTLGSALAASVPRFVDKTKIGSLASFDEYIVAQVQPNFNPTTAQRVFYTSNATTLAWTEISDGDFTGIVHRGKMEYIDGYAFVLSDKNLIWNSDLNSLQSWTATSFLAKQIRQDYAVGLMRHGNKLLAMGSGTAEVFYNGGVTTGSPLSRIAHQESLVGLRNPETTGGTHYYATVGNKIYFVGHRTGGTNSAGFFAYDGSNFDKVSTGYIDKILAEEGAAPLHSVFGVFSLGFNGKEALAICLTIIGGTQRWLMFFPEWKEWFEWTSTVFSPINYGGVFLNVASGANNKVYTFPPSDNWQDDGTSFEWLTQFRVPSNGSSRQIMSMYGVDADTDTSANTIAVAASDDDNASFYSLGTLDLTQDRKVLFRGGSYRKRHIRLSATDARPKRIHNFMARIG